MYNELSECISKFYATKSKKIQSNLESLEKLLNKATTLTINNSKKKKDSKDLEAKYKLKVTN